MKALCIGNGSAFSGLLVNELHNHGSDIFWLSEQKPVAISAMKRDFVHYPFSPADPNIIHIFRSIQPDLIVFWGAQAAPNKGQTQNQFSLTMLAELLHVLQLMDDCQVRRLVFFSDEEVFGDGAIGALTEESPCWPKTERGISLFNAERLLAVHALKPQRTVLVLRLSSVYGPQTAMRGRPDFALTCLAKAQAGITVKASAYMQFTPTYVLDAVKAASLLIGDDQAASGIYHISSGETVSQLAFLEGLLGSERAGQIQTVERTASLCLSGEKVHALYGFVPQVDIGRALQTTRQWAEANRFAYAKPAQAEMPEERAPRRKQVIRSFLATLKSIFESLALLAAAVAATRASAGSAILSQVNYLLVYVVMTASMSGMQAGAAAALLAFVARILFALGNTTLFDIMLDPSTYIHLAVLLLAGFFVGHRRDRLMERTRSAQAEQQQLQRQYDELMNIHEANVEIKNALENRLINYGDSFASIYAILSQLDVLEPQAIMQSAVGVIQRVLHATDVAIYAINSGHRFLRLETASSPAAHTLGKTITLEQYPALRDVVEDGAVYMNTALEAGYPQMMGLVTIDDQPAYALMLWGIAFSSLNVANRDLLAVTGRLIASSMRRARQYVKETANNRYVEGTFILQPAAFQRALSLLGDPQEQEGSAHCLLRVNPASYKGCTPEEISGRLTNLVRDADLLGLLEDGTLVILLKNTAIEEASVPMGRMRESGIETEVMLA